MKPSEFLHKHNPVSRDEMERYLSGKLSASDKKSVEEKLVDDEFASEAAEGFQQMNLNFAAVASVETAWSAKSKSIGAKGINYKYWFIGTVVVSVAVIIGTIYFLSDQNQELKENNTTQLNSNSVSEIKEEQKIASAESMSDEELKEEIIEIKEANQISASKQITYEKTIAQQPQTIEEIKPVETINIPEPEKVDDKEVEVIPVKDDKKIVESNVKMLYIKNLKAVDYSEFYTNHIAKKEWNLTGVTADKENSSSEGVIADRIITYIPYKEFLNETLTKFSKNDFKGTLSGLLTILQQYPDDINAAFYSGLCYYNLGKNKQAIAMFDKAIGNSITTFKEESEWYKCLSLIENKEKEEAKVLMKKIGEEGGFYAKSAREKLKGMK